MRRVFLNFMVAVVIGMLGSVPLADATGFVQLARDSGTETRLVLVCVCGFILFLLTLAVMAPVARLLGSLFATIGRLETRPRPLAAIGMMICGTLCVLTALYLAWASHAVNPALDAIQSMQQSLPHGASFNYSLPPNALKANMNNGPMLLTAMVFGLGTCLIALGVWSSLGPVATSLPSVKTPIPAIDTTSM